MHVPERDLAATQPHRGAGSLLQGCTSLREITLPPNLTEIGRFAFSSCTSLSEIALPPNLTDIGGCAFSECTSLSEITLPPQHVTIGHSAFAGCPGTPRRHEPAAPPGSSSVPQARSQRT